MAHNGRARVSIFSTFHVVNLVQIVQLRTKFLINVIFAPMFNKDLALVLS
jgi:hypothetical protein